MTATISPLARRRRRERQRRCCTDVILFALLLCGVVAVVEGFTSHCHNSNINKRRVVSSRPLNAEAAINDVDVVGEGRRGDANGAALRLVDVAVSRGGTTLLSNIDWRVEPKSKWAIVVSPSLLKEF